MFAKLLKYEWKANANLLWILSACALGVGLLGAGILRGITYVEDHMMNDVLGTLASSSLSMLMVFVVISLGVYALAVQFINIWRFYKNKFTDEGYLTFTLPVTSHQVFLSSFLVILAWMAISVAVLVISGGLMLLIGLNAPLKEVFQVLGKLFSSLGEALMYIEQGGMPGVVTFLVLCCLTVVVTPVYAIVLLMTSITLGCVLAKKHKILATIGMYYAINMAVNIVSSIVNLVPTILMVSSSFNHGERYFQFLSLTVGLSLVLQVGLAIGGYFWSTYLMKHKLNLP